MDQPPNRSYEFGAFRLDVRERFRSRRKRLTCCWRWSSGAGGWSRKKNYSKRSDATRLWKKPTWSPTSITASRFYVQRSINEDLLGGKMIYMRSISLIASAFVLGCIFTITLSQQNTDQKIVGAKNGISISDVREYRKMFRVNEKPIDMVAETARM